MYENKGHILKLGIPIEMLLVNYSKTTIWSEFKVYLSEFEEEKYIQYLVFKIEFQCLSFGF